MCFDIHSKFNINWFPEFTLEGEGIHAILQVTINPACFLGSFIIYHRCLNIFYLSYVRIFNCISKNSS